MYHPPSPVGSSIYRCRLFPNHHNDSKRRRRDLSDDHIHINHLLVRFLRGGNLCFYRLLQARVDAPSTLGTDSAEYRRSRDHRPLRNPLVRDARNVGSTGRRISKTHFKMGRPPGTSSLCGFICSHPFLTDSIRNFTTASQHDIPSRSTSTFNESHAVSLESGSTCPAKQRHGVEIPQ